jgi:hypothetical protein
MTDIEFYGKRMSLPEAKMYLIELKEGSIKLELNDLDRIGYNKMNEATRRDNEKKKARGETGLYEEYTEKGYLELLLEIEIGAREGINKINYMEKHGYFDFDKMTTEETIKFNRLLRTPFM